MTQLPIRPHVKRIADSRPTARYVATILVDIDRFRSVNDNRGYDAGDELLRQIAERLSSYDAVTSARVGPDEFVVVLAGNDYDQLTSTTRALAREILRDLDDVYLLPRPWPATVTAGVSTGTDFITTLRNAEDRIFEARAVGTYRKYGGTHPVGADDTAVDVPPAFDSPTDEHQVRLVISVPYAAGLRRRFGDTAWSAALSEIVNRIAEVTQTTPSALPSYEPLAARVFAATKTYTTADEMEVEGPALQAQLVTAFETALVALGGDTIVDVSVAREVAKRADRELWDALCDRAGEPRSEPPRFFVRATRRSKDARH